MTAPLIPAAGLIPSPAAGTTCGAVSPHGDVCVRQEGHTGLCRSVGRKHVSSPEQGGKPWRWYRSDLLASLSNEGKA